MGLRTDGRRGKSHCQAVDFMARPGGETSNSFLETLADWTSYLQNLLHDLDAGRVDVAGFPQKNAAARVVISRDLT